MEEEYYGILKGENDRFYLGKYKCCPRICTFCGIRVAKMNINESHSLFQMPFSFCPKRVSKAFFDSIIQILANTRDDVVEIINNQTRIERTNQQGEKCFFIGDDRIYIADLVLLGQDQWKSYSSIIVSTDGSFPEFVFEKTSITIKIIEKVTEGYYLDDVVYAELVHRTHKTVFDIKRLLEEAYSE